MRHPLVMPCSLPLHHPTDSSRHILLYFLGAPVVCLCMSWRLCGASGSCQPGRGEGRTPGGIHAHVVLATQIRLGGYVNSGIATPMVMIIASAKRIRVSLSDLGDHRDAERRLSVAPRARTAASRNNDAHGDVTSFGVRSRSCLGLHWGLGWCGASPEMDMHRAPFGTRTPLSTSKPRSAIFFVR